MANLAPPGSPGANVKAAGVKLTAKEKYNLVDQEASTVIEALKVLKQLHRQVVFTEKKHCKEGDSGWGFIVEGGNEVFLDTKTFNKSVNAIARSLSQLKATVKSNQKRVSGRAGQGQIRTQYLTAGKRLTVDTYNYFANEQALVNLKAAEGTLTQKVSASGNVTKTYTYTGDSANPFLTSLSTFQNGQNNRAISTHDLKRLLRLACVETGNYVPIKKQSYTKDGTPATYKNGTRKTTKKILYKLPGGLRGGNFNAAIKSLVDKKANKIRASPNVQGQLVGKRYVVVFQDAQQTQNYLAAVNAEIEAAAAAAKAAVDDVGAAPINKNFTLSNNLYQYIPVENRTAESQTAEDVFIDVNFLEKKEFGSLIGALMEKEQSVNSKGQNIMKFVDVQLAPNNDTEQLEFNLKRTEGNILKLGDSVWNYVA